MANTGKNLHKIISILVAILLFPFAVTIAVLSLVHVSFGAVVEVGIQVATTIAVVFTGIGIVYIASRTVKIGTRQYTYLYIASVYFISVYLVLASAEGVFRNYKDYAYIFALGGIFSFGWVVVLLTKQNQDFFRKSNARKFLFLVRVLVVIVFLPGFCELMFRTTFLNVFEPDSEVGYKLRPSSWFNINEKRFRGEVVTNDPKRVLVACIGDSTTFGTPYIFNHRDSFVFQLQSVLREKTKRNDIDVVNLGVPGYGSGRSVAQMHEFIRIGYRPDVFVAILGVTEEDDIVPGRITLNEWFFIAKYFHIATWFWYSSITTKEEDSYDRFQDNLAIMKNIAEKNGGTLILGTYPSTLEQEKLEYSNCVRRFADSENILMIDFEKRFIPKGIELSVDGTHPNRAGHKLIAELLAEHIFNEQIAGLRPQVDSR